MAKNLQLYKLGVVLDVQGAQGIRALADADRAAGKLDSSFDKLGKSAVRGFGDIKKAATDNAQKTQQALASALLAGKKNVGGLISEAKKAQAEFRALEKAEEKALRMASGGSRFSSLFGGGGGGPLGGIAEGLKMLPGLGMVAGGLGDIVGVMKSGQQIGFDFNRTMEEGSIAFEILLKHGGKAKQLLQDLDRMSPDSPFDLSKLVDTTPKLLAFKFGMEEVTRVLTAAGDAARTNEQKFDTITTQLGQIRTKGKVTLEDLLPIAETGVDVFGYLGNEVAKLDKKFAKLTGDDRQAALFKMIERGEIKARGTVEAILRGIEGEFGGMGKRIANETASGLESQTRDNTARTLGTATKSAFEGYKDFLRSLNVTLGSETVKGVSEMVDGAIGAAISGGKNIGGGLLEGLKGFGGVAGGRFVKEFEGPEGTDAHSPARAFIPIGQRAAQGFQIGFVQETAGDVMGMFQNRGGRSKFDARSQRQKLEEAADNPTVRAFFEAIRKAEGGAPNVIVGGRKFSDFSRHPNVVGLRTKDGPSTAAGSWQITGTNWRRLAPMLGLKDFGERNQLIAALHLLDEEGGLDRLLSGDVNGALRAAGNDWAALPGPLRGRKVSTDTFMRYFQQGGGRLSGGGAADSLTAPVRSAGGGALEAEYDRRVRDVLLFREEYDRKRASRRRSIEELERTLQEGAGEDGAGRFIMGDERRTIQGWIESQRRALAEFEAESEATAHKLAAAVTEAAAKLRAARLSDVFEPAALGQQFVRRDEYSAEFGDVVSVARSAEEWADIDRERARLDIVGRTRAAHQAALSGPIAQVDGGMTKHVVPESVLMLPGDLRDLGAAVKKAHEPIEGLIKRVSKLDSVMGAVSQIAGLLPQQQVGRKRGFFSKMLGFAAPFLNFIPGVGPILSAAASIGSSALGGDWGGALLGAAQGFSTGGVFRRPGGGASPGGAGSAAADLFNSLPRRELGGPVRRGRAYTVGDRGPRQYWEVFVPEEDGYVHPSVEAFERSVGGNGSAGPGGPGRVSLGNVRRGSMAAMIEKLLEAANRQAAAAEGLHGRIDSMPAEQVLTVGAKRNPGAVTDAFMAHGSRDPKVVEWMNRRVA